MDFSNTIMELRYSWDKEDGKKETWDEICNRVVDSVFSARDFLGKEEIKEKMKKYMYQRKFIPGGRFLAQSGREFHQVNNCFLLRAEDTREGWGDLLEKATLMLSSGGGIGIDYSDLRPKGAKLKRSGGTSSGPLPLMNVVNEVGRGVMAGGNRRSALWSGLRWSHPDVFEFITIKNWSDEVKKIKEKDFNFPATMDMTNISVILDKDFFDAYYDKENPKHEHAQKVYWMVIEQMVMTGEPGFSVDYDNPRESLRNACFTFDTPILTKDGYVEIGSLENKKFEIVSYDGTISNGKVWFSGIKEIIELNLSNGEKIRCTPNHVFMNSNGESVEAKDLKGQKLYPYSKDFENAPAVISIKNAGIEKVYDFNEPENNWGIVQGYVVHNCTEIVSEDDSDVCCLGSINFPRISNKEELAEITELAQLFLICGILYSDVPHEKVKEVKNKNMRTGLGIMGFHEWLIRHGYKYEPNAELAEWLSVWKESSDNAAEKWAKILNVPVPIKRRAIAPVGSISIAGGKTTSGIEPIFSLAYQRRYLTPDGWKKQYVVDFVAEKLHEEGFDLSGVEDAYSLSFDVERRIAFQEFVQKYVDNSISSTINLPAYGTPGNNNPKEFGEILIKYLPKLRGITVYPDGARGGQPLTPVPFEFAIDKKGVVFEGHEECVGGVCGL